MSIAENVRAVQKRVESAARRARRSPGEITLIAVTKTAAVEDILEAHAAGLRHFGENRVQDAQRKIEALAAIKESATWHMIGHLQSNKAALAGRLFAVLHGIDSVELGLALNKRLESRRRIFLEVNVAGEASKHGFRPEGVASALTALSKCEQLEICGLMTIAPKVDDPEKVRPVFKRLREMANELGLAELSMGMTDDFEVAIEEGATHVRIGRAIFH